MILTWIVNYTHVNLSKYIKYNKTLNEQNNKNLQIILDFLSSTTN